MTLSAGPVRLWFATSNAERESAMRIRMAVFVDEQGVPPDEEPDDYDSVALHLLASSSELLVATSRLVVLDGRVGLVGRVAVLPEWRRRGIAGTMLDMVEEKARQLGLFSLELHAQAYVTELYAKHGYVVVSAPYFEASIEHVTMRKVLQGH